MENKRIYLDTNIVADIIDSSRKGHLLSLKMLEYLALEDYSIFISEDMITTLYYILKNKQETLNFFKNLIFVDWNILTFGIDIIKYGTELSLDKNLDLEDVLQCLCAKENNCNILITNDIKFYDCGIKIYTAEQFLKENSDDN